MKIQMLNRRTISNLFFKHKFNLFIHQEKERNRILATDMICCVIITGVMLLSYFLALKALYILSGCLLLLLGIGLFILYFKKTKSYLNSRGLYFFFWLSAVGLSALKIHSMQVMWKWQTWICIWASLVMFLIGYNLALISKVQYSKIRCFHLDTLSVIYGLSAVVFMVFMLEVLVAGGFPLFSSNMEAYQSFALPFLHYITVTCVLVTPLTILYLWNNRCKGIQLFILIVINVIMLMIPVLIVSRQLLIMNVIFIFFTILELENKAKIPKQYILIMAGVLCVGWIFLSSSRNQSDAYIRQVFRLDDKLSVPLYRIYMYIAFNIDNFNDIVGRVDGYSYIYRALNPLFTLTGTKGFVEPFIHSVLPPRMLSVYNTYSFLQTPYGDMRELGVALYCTVSGFFTGSVEKGLRKKKNTKNVLFHVVVNYILMFSFFSAFLSNTSIWGYFIVILIVDLLISHR